MIIRRLTYIALALVLGIGLYLFLPNNYQRQIRPNVDQPRFGGTYKRALPGKPKTLDPAQCLDTTSSEVIGQIYSRLLRIDQKMQIQRDLASSYSISADKRVYSFTLKKKVRFHTITQNGLLTANQGREVTANDVKYSYERLLNPDTNSPNASLLHVIQGSDQFIKGESDQVSGIKIIDSHRLEIHLKNPFSPFLWILATHSLSIVPWEDVRRWGTAFHEHPVGSGPFIYERTTKSTLNESPFEGSMELRSNLDFHRGRPYLDKLKFLFIQQENVSYSLFERHAFFHMDRIPPEHLRNALRNKSYGFQERTSLEISYLGMNLEIAPFDNLHVRKALNYAVNKDLIVRHILSNRGGLANGPLSPGISGYDTNRLKGYEYNMNKARTHFREAGYQFDIHGLIKSFPELTLQINQSQLTKAIARVVQANLADLGIKLNLKSLPWSEHFQSIDRGESGFFSLGWVADYPDADNVLYNNFHSSGIESTYNSARYVNQEVDDLLDKAREIGDEATRMELYRKAEAIVIDEAPWIFLHYPTTYVVSHSYVNGLNLSAFGSSETDYYQVWLSPEAHLQ